MNMNSDDKVAENARFYYRQAGFGEPFLQHDFAGNPDLRLRKLAEFAEYHRAGVMPTASAAAWRRL